MENRSPPPPGHHFFGDATKRVIARDVCVQYVNVFALDEFGQLPRAHYVKRVAQCEFVIMNVGRAHCRAYGAIRAQREMHLMTAFEHGARQVGDVAFTTTEPFGRTNLEDA